MTHSEESILLHKISVALVATGNDISAFLTSSKLPAHHEHILGNMKVIEDCIMQLLSDTDKQYMINLIQDHKETKTLLDYLCTHKKDTMTLDEQHNLGNSLCAYKLQVYHLLDNAGIRTKLLSFS